MIKKVYQKPAAYVLLLAPMQETLQTTSITMGVAPSLMMGVDLDAPSDLSTDSYTDLFN